MMKSASEWRVNVSILITQKHMVVGNLKILRSILLWILVCIIIWFGMLLTLIL